MCKTLNSYLTAELLFWNVGFVSYDMFTLSIKNDC